MNVIPVVTPHPLGQKSGETGFEQVPNLTIL